MFSIFLCILNKKILFSFLCVIFCCCCSICEEFMVFVYNLIQFFILRFNLTFYALTIWFSLVSSLVSNLTNKIYTHKHTKWLNDHFYDNTQTLEKVWTVLSDPFYFLRFFNWSNLCLVYFQQQKFRLRLCIVS